jgi:hypothetical protein
MRRPREPPLGELPRQGEEPVGRGHHRGAPAHPASSCLAKQRARFRRNRFPKAAKPARNGSRLSMAPGTFCRGIGLSAS